MKKPNIRRLKNNYKKIFKKKLNTDLQIVNAYTQIYGLTMLASADVWSENNDKVYHVHIQFHKKDYSRPFTFDDICEVKCNCKSFKFYLAYPNVKNKTYYGKHEKYSKIENKIRNKDQKPGLCKHLLAFLNYLKDRYYLLNKFNP